MNQVGLQCDEMESRYYVVIFLYRPNGRSCCVMALISFVCLLLSRASFMLVENDSWEQVTMGDPLVVL